MIEARRRQCSFAEGLIREAVEDLWEDWMWYVDTVLDDESLLSTVYEALARRRPKSRTHGRLGTPAEVVLRMLLLKHLRNWSFDELEREVRSNLLYRQFTRVGGEKVPDAKTLGRLARTLGPEVIEKIHERVVAIALEQKVIRGRKLRVDTTVDVATLCYTSLSL
jgi:IS5 family transposase